MQYLIVTRTPIYRVSEHQFAVERVSGEQWQALAKNLRGVFDRFVLVAPRLSTEEYERTKTTLLHIHEMEEKIFAESLPIRSEKKLLWGWRDVNVILSQLGQRTRESDLLHSELSMTWGGSFTFLAILFALYYKRKTLFVVDRDFRRSATLELLAGHRSLGSWLLCKLLCDPLRQLQIAIAVRFCNLVLLQGRKLKHNWGANNPRVHEFLDAAHSAAQIAAPEILAKRASALCDPEQPLELVALGRLTPTKGIEETLRMLARVRERSALPFRFHIVGEGEERAHLQGIAEALRIARFVAFHDAPPSRAALFEKLQNFHLLLATPICDDAAHDALDALASGLPILAYDTAYSRDLARKSGAVFLSPWQDLRRLSTHLIELNKNRAPIAEKAERAIAFAKTNTQEAWIEQRAVWTLQVLNPFADTSFPIRHSRNL